MADTTTPGINPIEEFQEYKTRYNTISQEAETAKTTLDAEKAKLDGYKNQADGFLQAGTTAADAITTNYNANNIEAALAAETKVNEAISNLEGLLENVNTANTTLNAAATKLASLKTQAENLQSDSTRSLSNLKNLEPDIFNDKSTVGFWQFNDNTTPGKSGINGSYDAMSRFFTGFNDNNRELVVGYTADEPYYGLKFKLPSNPHEGALTEMTADVVALYKGLAQVDNTTSDQGEDPQYHNRRLFSAAKKPAIADNKNWTISFMYNTAYAKDGGLDFLSLKNHFYTTKVNYSVQGGTTKPLTQFALHEQMFFTNRTVNIGNDSSGVRSPFKDANTLPVLRIRLDAGYFTNPNGATINAPFVGSNYPTMNLRNKETVFGGLTYSEAFTLNPVVDYVQSLEGAAVAQVAITKESDFTNKSLRGALVVDPGTYYTYVNVYIKKDADINPVINYTWTFDVESGKIAAYVDGVKKIEFHIEITPKSGSKINYKPFFYNSFLATRTNDFNLEVTRWPSDADGAHTLSPANVIEAYKTNLPVEEANDWYQDKLIFFRFPYNTDINVYDKPLLKDFRILNKLVSSKELKTLVSETYTTNIDSVIDRENRIIYNIKPNIFRDGSDIAYAKVGEKPIVSKSWFNTYPESEAFDITSGYEPDKSPTIVKVTSGSDKPDFVKTGYGETTDFTVSFVVDKAFAPESATGLLVGMIGFSGADRTEQFETWQGKEYPSYSVPLSKKAESYFELRYNNAVIGALKYADTHKHLNNCIAFPVGEVATATTGHVGRILCGLTINTGVDPVGTYNRTLKAFSSDVIGAVYNAASFAHANPDVFTFAGGKTISLQAMSRAIVGGGSRWIKPVSLTTLFRHDSSTYNNIVQLMPDAFANLSKPNNGKQYDNSASVVKDITITANNTKSTLFNYSVASSGVATSVAADTSDLHLTTALYSNAIMNPANTLFVPVYDQDPEKVRVTIVASVEGETQTIKAYVNKELRDSVVIGAPNSDSTEDYNNTINNKVALRPLPYKFTTEVFGGTTPYATTTNHGKAYGVQSASQFFYNENLENNREDAGLAANKIHELSIFNRAVTVDEIGILVDSDAKAPGELIYDVIVPAEAPIIASADVDIDGNPSYQGVADPDAGQAAPAPTPGGEPVTPPVQPDPRPEVPTPGPETQPPAQPVPPTTTPDLGDFKIVYKEGIPSPSGTPVDVSAQTAGKKMKLSNVDLYFSVYSSETQKYSMIQEHVDSVQVDLSQIKKSGVYYIKRTQSGSVWEIVSARPIVGKESRTGDYYLGGDWYDKTGQKLEPLTYLPFHLVSDGKGLKTVAYNLYSGLSVETATGGVATLPEGEWFTMDNQREWGVIYTNTTKHTMMVVVAGDAGEDLTTNVTRSNSIEAYVLKNTETLMFLVEPNERYKVTNNGGVIKKWQEFKRIG